MERTIVQVVIPYFEDGIDKEKKFTVSRISRKVIKEYTEIILHLTAIREKTLARKRQVDNLGYEIAKLKGDLKNLKNARDEAKKIKAVIADLDKEIEKLQDRDIASECMVVVSRILKDNGIDDEQMQSAEFWEEHTEEADLWNFLSSVVYKDVHESKKKVM